MKPRSKAAPRNLDAGPFGVHVSSFELHLQAERKSAATVRTYAEATRWFAADWLLANTTKTDWGDVDGDDVRHWIVHLLASYSDSYANNQFRALQQFFKWYAAEEDSPNPMEGMSPPKVDEKRVPVFTSDELAALERTCKSRDFLSRRDAAIITFFRATGIRLSEMATLNVGDVDLRGREAVVTGKGGKQRTVKFDHETARAIDRYLRLRAGHRHADHPKLWLGTRNRAPMTANGIYQMIARRGDEAGVEVHPHKFRHHFSHAWLDNGGPEGDLMELNGWTSPQMLRRYGASARSARARRAYDRIMGPPS